MNKPLPCPFCGNEHISLRFIDSKQIMRVAYCRDVDCGARGPARLDDEWAMTAWNNRAVVAKLFSDMSKGLE